MAALGEIAYGAGMMLSRSRVLTLALACSFAVALVSGACGGSVDLGYPGPSGQGAGLASCAALAECCSGGSIPAALVTSCEDVVRNGDASLCQDDVQVYCGSSGFGTGAGEGTGGGTGSEDGGVVITPPPSFDGGSSDSGGAVVDGSASDGGCMSCADTGVVADGGAMEAGSEDSGFAVEDAGSPQCDDLEDCCAAPMFPSDRLSACFLVAQNSTPTLCQSVLAAYEAQHYCP